MSTFVRRAKRAAQMLIQKSPAAAIIRRQRARAIIRRSGLFDREWYLEQLGPAHATGDLVAHYVRTGAISGLSPSPIFDPDWYVSKYQSAAASGYAPFAHYLLTGASRGRSPHPAFDAAHYLESQPAARSHRGGVLGHYVEVGAPAGISPNPNFDARSYELAHPELDEPAFVHFARVAGRLFCTTGGYRHVPRMTSRFDRAASERWKRAVRATWRTAGMPSPEVSVIMPSKNRAAKVVTAAQSVLAQTYANFQLVIVDDGSDDGTADALAEVRQDPRVEFVRRESSGGVAAARNTGLARARGHYVAYLDSDNTWRPDFLELMVAFATTTDLRAAYAVSELHGEEDHQFRATPYDYAVLRERNYIDCIVVLHERSLLDEVGGFDESLRRMVDWDLLIRLGAATDLRLAPFIGTTYDLWETRDDRISNSEPWGYRYVIKAKYLLDWDRRVKEREPGLVSVVVAARGPRRHLDRCLDRLLRNTDHDELEIIIVDPGSPATRFYELQMLAEREPRVRIVRLSEELPFELATNLGVVEAHGETAVVLSAGVLVEPGWLRPLLAALDGGAAAAAPLVLRPSGAVASAGVAFAHRGQPHHLLQGHAGESPEARKPGHRSGLASTCLVMRTADFAAAEGLDVMFVNDIGSPDLSLRLIEATGRPLCYEPDSVVIQLDRPKDRPLVDTDIDNYRHFIRRWASVVKPDAADRWADLGFSVIGYASISDSSTDETFVTHRPLILHDRPARPLRWAIKIAAPDIVGSQGWGDHYFALGLKEALDRHGHEAVIDFAGAWYRDSAHLDDVVLVLRGKIAYVPHPAQLTLLWLISHPDTFTDIEALGSDHILVASVPFANELADRYRKPVEPLLQCTDPHRFGPGERDKHRAHSVLFVGNSRGVERRVLRDALAAGLDLAVYGQGWDRFLPPGVVRGSYIPNAELAATYRAAGVVLNDHWEDMGRHGFLSNRLFDLAACCARVVSDDAQGMRDVFDDVVATYRSPSDLADVVRRQLADDAERAAKRWRLAERVRSEHSFDARVKRLIEIVEQGGRTMRRSDLVEMR